MGRRATKTLGIDIVENFRREACILSMLTETGLAQTINILNLTRLRAGL